MKATKLVSMLLCASIIVWLPGCASAPSAPPVVQTCPKVPPLDLSLPPAPARSYTEMMESFLRGSLPTPTDYALPSNTARLPTMR